MRAGRVRAGQPQVCGPLYHSPHPRRPPARRSLPPWSPVCLPPAAAAVSFLPAVPLLLRIQAFSRHLPDSLPMHGLRRAGLDRQESHKMPYLSGAARAAAGARVDRNHRPCPATSTIVHPS